MEPRDLSIQLRFFARQAAADLQIPLQQVNLLRLAHWLANQSKACAQVLR